MVEQSRNHSDPASPPVPGPHAPPGNPASTVKAGCSLERSTRRPYQWRHPEPAARPAIVARLEEIERLRAEYLGIVSHELRMPLTSIKGSEATVLGATLARDTAEMLQFFRLIDEQADHMRSLIGDLLDHGRIVTGTLSVSPEPMEVSALVDQARSTFLSGRRGHALSIDLPQVMADRARIVQVLGDLLSDAARHSPESSPIRLAATREGVCVAISVADKGRGVPPDRLPHLFRKYSRGCRHEGGPARGVWRGPRHLQGAGRGPRRPDLGRERRRGTRDATDLHGAGGGSAGERGNRRDAGPPAPAAGRPGADAHPASWWSTTTRRCSGAPGRRSPRRATLRS